MATRTTLTDNQRAVLTAAARSANLIAWPLPRRLNLSPGSAAIVTRELLQKGLIEKRPAMDADPVWREEGGKSLTLVITKAGLAACGVTAASEQTQKAPAAAGKAAVAGVSHGEQPVPRPGSKLAILVALISRDEGATIEEMVTATGWQAHTVRGVMSGALVKRFGLQIGSEKVEERGRVYRIVS